MKKLLQRWLPHPALTLLLTAVWLLLNQSLAPAQLLLGAGLGVALPRLTHAFWPHPVPLARPRAALRLAGVFAWDVLLANLAVARRVLGDPARLRPAFVTVQLDLGDDLALSLLANLVCLTPGTVSARLSADRRELLVHALDCADPAALAATIKVRFEAPLKELFAC